MPLAGQVSRLAIVAAASAIWLAAAAPCAAQIDAGLLARMHDREIASVYDSTSRRTAITLTLVLPGPRGLAPQAALMLTGEFAGRDPAPGTTQFSVRTHITPLSDPRRRDPRTLVEGRDLIFELDPHTGTGIRLFFYAGNYGYGGFVPPGDEVPLAFFTLTSAEVRALAVSREITGFALGSEFVLTPGQLDALREFAGRTLP